MRQILDDLLADELAAMIERTEELRVQLENCIDEIYAKKLKMELDEAVSRTIELQAPSAALLEQTGPAVASVSSVR